MPYFSHADKLALMLTSAGSQRKLAAYLGASHQQVGRWLKGERINEATGVITNRPSTSYAAVIDAAFPAYVKAAKAATVAQGLPWHAEAPVNSERLRMTKGPKAGAEGLRVLIRNTDTLSPELFAALMETRIDSGAFYEVSVRSIVDLADYMESGDDEQERKRRRRSDTAEKHRAGLMRKLRAGVTHVPVWTRRESALPQHLDSTLMGIAKKVRQRHAPAAVSPQSKLRDQVIFSINPKKLNDSAQSSKKSANRPTGKKRRKPGPR